MRGSAHTRGLLTDTRLRLHPREALLVYKGELPRPAAQYAPTRGAGFLRTIKGAGAYSAPLASLTIVPGFLAFNAPKLVGWFCDQVYKRLSTARLILIKR